MDNPSNYKEWYACVIERGPAEALRLSGLNVSGADNRIESIIAMLCYLSHKLSDLEKRGQGITIRS